MMTTARTAMTTTLPCPTLTARPKVRSAPHQTRHRRQTTDNCEVCASWRLETHESRWCRVATNASVLLVPTVCVTVTRDAVVLHAVRLSLSS